MESARKEPNFINSVKALHNEMQAHVAQGNHISKKFAAINDVKQDSVLAATLFSLNNHNARSNL